MGETGKPNGSSHGTATSDTLSRIARLISANDDVAQPDASDAQNAEAKMDSAGTNTNTSPSLGEIVSDELLDAFPAGLAVSLGTRLVKANASFALAFGYRDTAELEEAGSTEALFGEAAVNLEKCLEEAEAAAENKAELKAKTRSGRMITIPVAVHAIESGTDEPARLIVLHPRTGDDAKDVAARIALDPASLESREPAAKPEAENATAEDDEVSAAGESGSNGDSGRKKKKRKKKRNQERIVSSGDETGTADFLAKVSHELRTPLNSIIGFAEMMKDEQLGPVGNERYRSYIRDIHDSGLYALSLVNDLLDISKIKSGEFELNFAAVNLEEVISESVQSMQPQAQRRRVLLRTSFADDLPPVLADRRSVRQIILNLVSNAIKFTLPGGQVIVSVLKTEKDGVRIRVRDTGIGMSKNEVAVAMKPYKQVDSAPKSQIGTGLGLPLTKALVEANRARFKVRSASGTGTRVDVTFPKDRVADPRS